MKKIIILFSTLILSMSLCACNKEIVANTPTEAINTFANSLKDGDIEKATSVLDNSEIDISSLEDSFKNSSSKDVYSTIFQKLSIDCSDEQINEETATVNVKIENINVMAAMFALSYVEVDEEDSKQLLEYFNKSIKNVELEKIEVTANLIQKNEKWYISESNDSFLMAIMGVDEKTLNAALEE